MHGEAEDFGSSECERLGAQAAMSLQPRSPFSRSTSASSTPKRKYAEMREADSPAWQNGMRMHTATEWVASHLESSHHAYHCQQVPCTDLAQDLPAALDRYQSPALQMRFAITDLALADDAECGSPRALGHGVEGHAACRFGAQNSVDSDDLVHLMDERRNDEGTEISNKDGLRDGALQHADAVEHVPALEGTDDDTGRCVSILLCYNTQGAAVTHETACLRQCESQFKPYALFISACATADVLLCRYGSDAPVIGDTPEAVSDQSVSSYESPPSLVPPAHATRLLTRSTANICGSGQGSACTVEMGSCSPMHIAASPCMLADPDGGGNVSADSSPCMRMSIAFAPEQDVHDAPHILQSREHPENRICILETMSSMLESPGGSADSVSGSSRRQGAYCMESESSGKAESSQDSGSTVHSGCSDMELENRCPNALDSVPDTPSSHTASVDGLDQGATSVHNDASARLQGAPALLPSESFSLCGPQNDPLDGVNAAPADGQTGRDHCAQHTPHGRTRPEDDSRSLATMASASSVQQPAESLTSDELNAWKAQHCIPALTQETPDDSLVILTNKLLRAAFRAQRRFDMQRTLSAGGSYAAPRRFLSSPLDPSVLDALAVPVTTRASEMSETVETIINATLPHALRLSHCFAAWRYIMCVSTALQQPPASHVWHASCPQAQAACQVLHVRSMLLAAVPAQVAVTCLGASLKMR
jgi:hypothetical protein